MPKTPQCVFESLTGQLPLAIEFHDRQGQIHGFPYGHLLNYLSERNPDVTTDAAAPVDRFSLWFSTHDVVLVGWRLANGLSGTSRLFVILWPPPSIGMSSPGVESPSARRKA